MRKKSIIVVLLVLLMSVVAFACAGGNKYKLDDYTDFTGGDNSLKLELDEDMKLDGIMDEEAWANVGNKMSVTSSHTHAGAEDKALKMDVYTHFGEKALYFAFDVTDNTIFVNPSRRQSRNTGVELYMSALDNFTFGKGCVSIRITPMENGTAPIIGYYVPSGAAGWFQSKAGGKYAAATMVDGQYNVRNGANGYVVELAISYDLIGGKTDAIQYTAAFVQALSADKEDRLDNTFLKGTSYVSPGGWIGVTETGTLVGDAKYDFLDSNYVTTDSYMNVDGKLDDEKWQELIAAGKGKTITHKGKDITLTTYALFGDNGVYIGLDSNDPEVWYNPDRQAKYNTGAEIFVTALGATELSNDSTVQIRFSVGGGSLRYRANPNAEYPYTQSYFPAKIAGSVKNGGEFNKSVTDDYAGVDGWQGEIFIPWTAFGATTEEQKSQIAVFNCIYYSRSDAENPTGDQWKFLAPADSKVYGNGSRNVNPQKSFFRFTKADGFVFGGVEVPDVVFFKGNDGSYKATIKPRYVDAVTSADFATDTKLATGGTFSVTGIPTDSFTDNGDGTYTMTVSAENAKKFERGKEAHFSLAEGVGADFTIEYIDVDSSKFDVNKLIAYLNFDGTAKTTAGSAASSVTRGTAEFVKYGTGSANNGYYAANMRKSSVKLDATLGTDSFVMSAMVNGADVKNYFKNETTFGYSFVLFGTGNVDGTVGFSLQARRDNVFIRLPNGKRYSHAAVLDFVTDGWQRWTLSVDRETTDKLTYTLYIDAEKVATNTIDLASDLSFDIENNSTIGIGAPGCALDGDGTGNGYTDKSVGIDEFVCATGAYSFGEMLNMVAWTNEAHARYAFDADDIRFDYNDVTTDGYTQQIRVAAYREDGTTADVTDVTFGAEIAPYITQATDADYFTLTIPANKVGEFKDGVATTYTYNGATRKLTVKYDALERIYLDVTGVSAWKKNKVGDNYVFTVGVYGKSDLSAIVKGAEFSEWDSYKNDNGDGTYTFTVPASVVEALDAPKTITVTKGADVTTASFTFEYKCYTAAELAALANATEAYIDFDNGNVTDKVQNKAYVLDTREDANIVDGAKYEGDKYLAANQKKTSVKLATALGTDSFSVSMLVNGADVRKYALDDYINGVPGAKAGYAFVLFGTGNVDGANGFSVRVRKDIVQVKIGSSNKGYGANVLSKITDNWQRWTVTFDRSTEGTVKYVVYIDGVAVINDSVAYGGSFDVEGFGTLGIGAPGCALDNNGNGYTDKSIGLDNFVLVRKALTAHEVEGLDSYYGDILKKVGWYVDNFTFDFTDVTENQAYNALINFTTNGSGANISGATFEGFPEGVTYEESQSAPGSYRVTIPYERFDEFKAGMTITAKIGNSTRTFTVKYVPLTNVYLDTTAVSMWSHEATDGNYEFNVGAYADESKTFALTEVTFGDWNEYATYDTANKVYKFAVPASVVEALENGTKTVTAARGEGVETASFTFTYETMSDAQINELAQATKAYIDFNGAVIDRVGGNAFVDRGEVVYGDGTKYEGDKYYSANQKKTSVKLATTLGTDSFTVSMLVNGADIKNYAENGYAFVLFGTGNVDGANGFSVRVRSKTVQVKIGGSNVAYNEVVPAITTAWQRWTVTFDRSTEGTLKFAIYLDGVKVLDKTVAYAASFDVDGFGTLGIGAPGCALDQYSYTDKSIGLDEFMLVNRVLTAREIVALDSYYVAISDVWGWNANDITIKYDQVTANVDKTVEFEMTKYASGANTVGATFTGLPEGVTIAAGETAGKYVLTVPYDKLASLKGGVTVTAKIGDVERSFKITYVPLDNLYVDTVNFYEYEVDAGAAVTRTIKVTADAAGAVGVAGASFAGYPDGVTIVENDSVAGEYTLTVPAAKIAELVASTVTASYDGVTANVTMAYNEAILKDTAVYSNIDTESKKDSGKQGGQVFKGIDLGNGSFTVAFMADNLNKIASGGGGYILFSTGNTDVSKGINVYANSDKFRFRCAGVGSNFPIPHNLKQYTDWTHLAFTFDRSVAGKLTITAYVNYAKVGSTTQTLTSDETFTYGESKNFVVGSINGEMWAESGAMANTNQYNLSAAGVTIYRGVAPIGAVQTYFENYLDGMTLPENALQARFTFADGTTANSVADSSVTMTKNENATETIADGKDGGTDKAIKINSKSAYYDVNGFDVSTGSFAVSMDLKMDFSTALTENGSGIVLFATTDPGSASGIAVTIRKNKFRVRINGATQFLTVNTDSYTGKWTNITVAFVRENGKCTINVYFNHALAATSGAFDLADTVSLANSEKDGYFGIGKGVEISGSTGTDYTDGVFKWYEDNTHTIDNVMLISGAMTDKNVLALRNI